MTVKIYTPLGMLGYGFPEKSLRNAVKFGVDVIATDAGSTDPGPYYLGSGKSYTSKAMVKRDLGLLIGAAQELKVPLLVGSSGGSGGIPHVNWVIKILDEILKDNGDNGYKLKIARIDAEFESEEIVRALKENKIHKFETERLPTESEIRQCSHIVAQMGIQPYIEALKNGADIIIGGRSYDAAVIAAFPIWKGEDPGLSYHMGKIMECGSIVALPRESDGLIGIIEGDAFRVFPADENKRCFPDTVAAHTLYERSTPFYSEFPGGGLDLRDCTFTAYDDRTVEITGSRFVKSEKNLIKLEGSGLKGYRSICPAGMRDPFFNEHFAEVEEKVREKLTKDLPQFKAETDYHVIFHRYGAGEVMGIHEPEILKPKEVGLIIDVVAHDQVTANTICALCRSAILHIGYEGRKANAGNIALLYTPAEFPAPPCYEFLVYHLMEVDSLTDPFKITYMEV